MPQPPIERALQLAGQLHRGGDFSSAEKLYRQILEVEPGHAEALCLLGVLFSQTSRRGMAIELIERSISIDPNSAQAYARLGDVTRDGGQLDQAILAYSKAVDLAPDWPEIRGALGNVLKDRGEIERAVSQYQKAIELQPDLAEAHANLGVALYDLGKLDEAIAAYSRALHLNPNLSQTHNNLGNALSDQGKLDQAIAAYERAIECNANYAEAYCNLGVALKAKGQLDRAIVAYQRAIDLNPAFPQALANLGNVLKDQGKLDEAIASYTKAIELDPNLPDAYNNLGNALKDAGRVDEAIDCYDKAMSLAPENPTPRSNRICALHFRGGTTAEEIYSEARRWNQRYAEPLKQLILSHDNDSDPNRRLRVGYVSPDFRVHPIGRFILPLLESHDHREVEIFCYSDVVTPDGQTERLRAAADHWRNIVGLSDAQAADLIRQDRIDILVDLTMHMANNRLLVFARKPAPVQVTYLAYCSTTGLNAMDYRLSDPYLDPSDSRGDVYSEKTIRLPETYWCYQPPENMPEVNLLPALSTGRITFASLNNFAKITPEALYLWGQLLALVPHSRLLLTAGQGSHRRRAADLLVAHGVDASRLIFLDFLPATQYFQAYHQIDIALDSFPYVGGTTTCDALWMGVPVITLAGNMASSRGGVSLLTNLGLGELIAPTPDAYISIAAKLAGDLPRLSNLRDSLRERMRKSPLTNGPRFARNVEQAYRTMWKQWLIDPPQSGRELFQ